MEYIRGKGLDILWACGLRMNCVQSLKFSAARLLFFFPLLLMLDAHSLQACCVGGLFLMWCQSCTVYYETITSVPPAFLCSLSQHGSHTQTADAPPSWYLARNPVWESHHWQPQKQGVFFPSVVSSRKKPCVWFFYFFILILHFACFLYNPAGGGIWLLPGKQREKDIGAHEKAHLKEEDGGSE